MISSLKIGYRRYRVEPLDANESRRIERYGDCDVEDGLIRVADGRPEPHQAETLVHEALHAMCRDAGVIEPRAEEELVSWLAPRVAAFLADNPEQVVELLRMFGWEPEIDWGAVARILRAGGIGVEAALEAVAGLDPDAEGA